MQRNGSASIAAAYPGNQPLSVHHMPESRRLLTADRRDGFSAYDLRKPGRVLQMLTACLHACLQASYLLIWVSHRGWELACFVVQAGSKYCAEAGRGHLLQGCPSEQCAVARRVQLTNLSRAAGQLILLFTA